MLLSQFSSIIYRRVCVVQILSQMEVSLLHQIRYEYNKTGRMLNRTKLNPQTMLSQHVTVVMDAIQVKVCFHLY